MRGARSVISEACGGGGVAWLGAELLGDEAEDARAFVLVEALALTPPAVEFEMPRRHDGFLGRRDGCAVVDYFSSSSGISLDLAKWRSEPVFNGVVSCTGMESRTAAPSFP